MRKISVRKISWQCDKCGTESANYGSSSFPKGWKTRSGNHLCPECWGPAQAGAAPVATAPQKGAAGFQKLAEELFVGKYVVVRRDREVWYGHVESICVTKVLLKNASTTGWLESCMGAKRYTTTSRDAVILAYDSIELVPSLKEKTP